MKKNEIVILFMMLAFSSCQAQKISSVQCEKCDISKVTSVYNKQKETITYDDVKLFLCTLDESCKNNVEYSELSNETLYGLLEKKPEIVVDVLNGEKGLKAKYIYQVLESPINDSFDLKKIYTGIEKLEPKSEAKTKLLKAIKVAMNKS